MPKIRATSPAKRRVAQRKLDETHAYRKAGEAEAIRRRRKEYRDALKAFNMGLTYEEIAETIELSPIRVSQILKEQRAMANGNG